MRSLRYTCGDSEALVRWRATPAGIRGSQGLWGTGRLTPYLMETIDSDGLRSGQGGRLEVTISPHMSEPEVARVRTRLAWLLARGVEVSVRRGRTDDGNDPAQIA